MAAVASLSLGILSAGCGNKDTSATTPVNEEVGKKAAENAKAAAHKHIPNKWTRRTGGRSRPRSRDGHTTKRQRGGDGRSHRHDFFTLLPDRSQTAFTRHGQAGAFV